MSATRDSGLTRKQRREQARVERKAREAAERARAARRQRLMWLTGAISVVVVIIAVILIAANSGTKKILAGSPEAAKTAEEVQGLIGGIPQSGNVLGSPSAPITLKYFGDLECSTCRRFTLGGLPSLIEQWVRAGKVKIEYHSMETATQDPEVFRSQQIAAYAAGKQNKAWYFIETFYHEQGEEGTDYATETYLHNIAKQVPGLNLTQWSKDRGDTELAEEVEADKQTVSEEGFNSTPSFLLGKTGGAMRKLGYSSTAVLENPGGFDKVIEAVAKE